MDLYCLNYNNYYNRIIKKEETIEGYLPYLLDRVMTNIAFNPSDGVTTNQILNWNDVSMPDYIVVVSGTEIVSRWFVIEMSRTRNGQYSLVLKRDLIVDHYQPIINAPCFIEKATLNQDDPMIFNSEDMTFNQIKTSETLLKDGSRSAWIVGYYAKDFVDPQDSSISLNAKGDDKVIVDNRADIIIEGNIENWEYNSYITNPFYTKNYNNFYYVINATKYFGEIEGINKYYKYSFYFNQNASYDEPYRPLINNAESINVINSQYGSAAYGSRMNYTEMNSELQSNLGEYFSITINDNQSINQFLTLKGKTISYTKDGKTVKKKINIKPITKQVNTEIPSNKELFNLMNNGIQWLFDNGTISGQANNSSFEVNAIFDGYQMELQEVYDYGYEFEIPNKSNRYNVNDQPYSMFAIPYGNILVDGIQSPIYSIRTSPEVALATAYKIIEKYSGSGTVYDVQLLPYCPIQGIIKNGIGDIDLGEDSLLYSLIYHENEDGSKEYKGVILNCIENTFSFDIPCEITVSDKKTENLTDIYRLSSPNYNGNFQFSAAKNGGIDRINVDCEYKPFTPYIHLNPNFKELYGSDFNDARGLICGGDFGLTQTSDNWSNYQIQNKNFQQMFNRQIENMEVNNSIQKEKEIWGAVSGTIQAGISGATAGGLIGGGIGAAIGGGIGALTSGLAGARDIQLNQRLRNESLDYTKDQFGYQLGNIKALPDNLTKVSSFNPNNKIFPILEYYTCTEVEKNALKNKLKYNGMTVMRIGTIAEFLKTEKTYIKGKLIRLEGISDDFHIINEIANEIYKGVFI